MFIIGNTISTDKNMTENITFVSWIRHWIEMKAPTAEETTVAQYLNCLSRYIQPYFQDMNLQVVDENALQYFFDTLGPAGKQLSAQTIHLVKCIIHQALDYAVNTRLLLYNPEDLTYILNRSYNRYELLKKDLIIKILQKDYHQAYENLYPLLLLTAMRYGECAGLSWEAVDFKRKTLHIQHQLVEFKQNAHTVRMIKPYPKNHKDRTILIPENACRYLVEQKNLQNRYRTKYKAIWNNPYNLVFTDPDGSMLKHYKVTRRFKALARTCEMPDATLRTIRHTGCSLLYYCTNNLSLLRDYTGHSSDGAAYYYIHSLENMQGDPSL